MTFSVGPDLDRKSQRAAVGCMKGTVQIHGDLAEPSIPETEWEMHK
jgi:hypothetical protein